MRCGAATVDITPDRPVELSGYVARRQPSMGVRDPVLGRALYIEEDGRRLLWLHADVIALDRALRTRVLRRLQGLAPDEILVTATHTHSAPATIHLINCGEPDPAYLESLEDRLLEAARVAMDCPEQAAMVAGTSLLSLGRDRRGQAKAHVSPVVTALGWKRADGSFIAVVTNYAMHNVALSHNNRLISGDVAGETARLLSERLPGCPCVLTSNGACGNINPPEVRDDDALMKEWGATLAGAVEDALSNSAPAVGGIRAAWREMDVLADAPSADAIRALAARHLEGLGSQEGYVPDRIRDAICRWRDRWLAEPANPSRGALLPMGIHAIVLGGIPIAAFAAEVFSVMTDRLAERIGRRVMVVGYANGDVGYLAPDTAYDEGGYEVDAACVFYGTPPIPRGAFERAGMAAAGMLEALI